MNNPLSNTPAPSPEQRVDALSASAPAPQPTPKDKAYPPYTPLALPLLYYISDPHQKAAYTATQMWLNDIIHNAKEHARWLILFGKTGSGKSHLLHNSIRLLREFRKKPVSKRASDIATALREGNSHSMHQIWIPSYIFAIDDFGAEYHTDFMTSQWFDLLDARVGKWTFITSNLTPEQWEKRYGSRIASRLMDSRNSVVDLTQAADYRRTRAILSVNHSFNTPAF